MEARVWVRKEQNKIVKHPMHKAGDGSVLKVGEEKEIGKPCLKKNLLKEGEGWDILQIHYTGILLEFDSSGDRGTSISSLGQEERKDMKKKCLEWKRLAMEPGASFFQKITSENLKEQHRLFSFFIIVY
ncbi:putative peptidylprolyl isomerase [Rosa chinensis]|uniref:Putative peptidylprolyl isomerase n=1 Tax=Rosa chinensis TaxID=74649 RepID=A0A2P6PLQ1_ROSCH|nr:putative peptidylprolyl isomerase [Rosa chinensis]